jgi:7,8-dihydro-6-hydroxymethylpterin dimethyltransferase
MRRPFPVEVRLAGSVSPLLLSAKQPLEVLADGLRSLDLASAKLRFQLEGHAKLLKTTLSLCPDCLTHVPAAVFVESSRVLMKKQCVEHGVTHALIESDERYYRLSNKDKWGNRYDTERVMDIPPYQGMDSCCGPGETCEQVLSSVANSDFQDQLSNKSCTVLVEVTDACNLACRVCYADSRGDRILPLEMFKEHIVQLIVKKGVLDSMQITGGEASLHPDFWKMISFLHALPGLRKIYLPTNGIEFGKPGIAQKLVPFQDKVLLLLQFDGRDRSANRSLRQASPERLRLKLLKQLEKLGIATQLTMTLAKDTNEKDIEWVIKQGLRHNNVRLVALQPVTYSGRYDLIPDAMNRLTLSDMVKGIERGLGKRARQEDFMPIPCSHPNCGWVTLLARRFGFAFNIARYVNLESVMNQVAYKTVLTADEMQGIFGTKVNSVKALLARISRRMIKPRHVFGIAIKPFMDRFNYDLDRVSACCHHLLDTNGQLTSFCEYNARLRPLDSWAKFPQIERQDITAPKT